MQKAEQNNSSQSRALSSSAEQHQGIPFIIYEPKNGFYLNPEAEQYLQNLPKEKKLGVISIVGKYRTGKSFLINRVILNRTGVNCGFTVGPTINPCTKVARAPAAAPHRHPPLSPCPAPASSQVSQRAREALPPRTCARSHRLCPLPRQAVHTRDGLYPAFGRHIHCRSPSAGPHTFSGSARVQLVRTCSAGPQPFSWSACIQLI